MSARNDDAFRWRPVFVLGAAAFSAALVVEAGPATACESVQIAAEPAGTTQEWEAAIVNLREQMRRSGTPWSCVGGTLLIQIGEGERAVLHFRDLEGNQVARHVSSLRALAPTAEAVMAASSRSEMAREEVPAVAAEKRELPPQVSMDPSAGTSGGRGEPRYLFDATLGTRFSGPAAAVWLAPGLRATVPLDAWSVGVWFRCGLPYVFDIEVKDFSMTQVNVGFSGGRQLLSAPVDLRLTFDPSLSVISMDADAGTHEASGAKIDVYLGGRLSAAMPVGRTWRALLAFDAEMVPASLRAERRIDPALPALPAYEIGIALGVELVAR